MPEPDFDQLTVDLAARVGRGDILPHIKEQLRQVWNARGVADVEVIRAYNSDDELKRIVRSLDR